MRDPRHVHPRRSFSRPVVRSLQRNVPLARALIQTGERAHAIQSVPREREFLLHVTSVRRPRVLPELRLDLLLGNVAGDLQLRLDEQVAADLQLTHRELVGINDC